jgi:hypothetical protein
MKFAGITIRRRLFVGFGLAVAVTGAWVVWTRQQKPLAGAPPRGAEPFVKLAGDDATQDARDRVLAERAMYFDPTPLFIPTKWNYGQEPLPARVERQPGQVFADFRAKLNFSEANLARYGAGEENVTVSLPEILARGNEAPFAGFGEGDTLRPTLPGRSGFVSVKALHDGNLVLATSLENLKLPQRDFLPVEFLVAVGKTGLLGEPVLTVGSGADEVDAAIRDHLVKIFRLGERLAPGRYMVSVGP